jgi:hypothetical protein
MRKNSVSPTKQLLIDLAGSIPLILSQLGTIKTKREREART